MALPEVSTFILNHRVAALAVSSDPAPITAMTSYVPEDEHGSRVLIHLSNLSPHKKALLANPTCSLLIAEPDDGRAEPMSLARVSLQGTAIMLNKLSEDYAQAKARFLARFPGSAVMFDLPDFDLFRVTFTEGRFIGGFGRAFAFTADQLLA
ncbi:MAG: pyridoxamine 5'-phosphate oxidase family protein [Anaerolineae bacterium]|nr:pyridoxamine 5'-phosphate oxidase family protein [Thermoflexales bacterium]MDW8396194.1 pyridoxamine 5'-phosphate oxidase family protein [Anaerolineae bacterium]